MHMKASDSYSLRAVLYLATHDGVCSSRDIAEDLSIPRDYLIQLAQQLRNAGIIEARSGKSGGYLLARDASDISMLDVLNALNGGASSASEGAPASGAQDDAAASEVDRAFDLAIEDVSAYMANLTIAELLQRAR